MEAERNKQIEVGLCFACSSGQSFRSSSSLKNPSACNERQQTVCNLCGIRGIFSEMYHCTDPITVRIVNHMILYAEDVRCACRQNRNSCNADNAKKVRLGT